LAEIIKDPKKEEMLRKFNLPCLTCPMASVEVGTLKLGEVCQLYGINLEKLLKELNKKRT